MAVLDSMSDAVVCMNRVQELCESRGGRPGLSVLMSLMVSVDVKQHWVSVDVKHHVYLLKQH